jgi:hypothetical protein
MARGLWAYAAKIGVLSVYVAEQCESRRYQYTDNIRRKIAASDTFCVVQIEFDHSAATSLFPLTSIRNVRPSVQQGRSGCVQP